MALTGHTERMKMRFGANVCSIYVYFLMQCPMALKGHTKADENIRGGAQRRRIFLVQRARTSVGRGSLGAHQTVAASTIIRLFMMGLLWAT